MHKHPDADAFMRSYLAQPADAVSRLVFADWLEETGEAHNSAWAHYIRLKIEADRHDFHTRERRELDRRADEYAPKIRAMLTISARQFIDYRKSLLQLLPAPNITVRLASFTVARPVLELMPESVARENLLFPLDLQGDTLLIAGADPHNNDTAQKLAFILNHEIVLVRANHEELQDALDHHFGAWNVENFDSSPLLTEFADTAGGSSGYYEIAEVDAPVVRLVNLLLGEAVNRRSDRVLLFPDLSAIVVRFRIAGAWVERDHIPLRLLRSLTTRLAIMAGIDLRSMFAETVTTFGLSGEFVFPMQSARFHIHVQMTGLPDDLSTQLDIAEEPA